MITYSINLSYSCSTASTLSCATYFSFVKKLYEKEKTGEIQNRHSITFQKQKRKDVIYE